MKRAYVMTLLGAVVLAVVVIITFSVFNSLSGPGTPAAVNAVDSNTFITDPAVLDSILSDSNPADGETVAYTDKHTTCERRWEWHEEHSNY